MKRVKVNLASDHSEVIEVADDWVLPPLEGSEWLEVESVNGDIFAFVTRLVVAIAVTTRDCS